MNDKQEKFLREFHDLCKKYSIARVFPSNGSVIFESNMQYLKFDRYEKGTFKAVATSIEEFCAEEEI